MDNQISIKENLFLVLKGLFVVVAFCAFVYAGAMADFYYKKQIVKQAIIELQEQNKINKN